MGRLRRRNRGSEESPEFTFTSAGYSGPLLVTAHLASPIAGSPPQLDALLEWAASGPQLSESKQDRISAAEPWKITRDRPAPPQGEIRIPLLRKTLGAWHVACCSGPICSLSAIDTVEHFGKRLATEEAGLLDPSARGIVSTTNSWTKSYRLPLHVRIPARIAWFCVGTRRDILKLLKRIPSLGKKRSIGFGRVEKWEAEHSSEDYSWFAPHQAGTMLMRVLPAGPWLPSDLVGGKKDFGACVAPYWHPSRYCETVSPI